MNGWIFVASSCLCDLPIQDTQVHMKQFYLTHYYVLGKTVSCVYLQNVAIIINIYLIIINKLTIINP